MLVPANSTCTGHQEPNAAVTAAEEQCDGNRSAAAAQNDKKVAVAEKSSGQ